MVPYSEISDYISELISRGYSSLARDGGLGNLKTFKTIEGGLNYLSNNTEVYSEDITKCVVTLKLLVDLRENIVKSKDVEDSQIPNIYTSANNLNDLLVKSANKTMKNDSIQSVTTQCEAFLKAADEIRRDKKLTGLGVLDGNLKNVIGRLRKKSTIESVFGNNPLSECEQIITNAEEILASGKLKEIAEELQHIYQACEAQSDGALHKKRLISFIKRYEKQFFNKIKSRINHLYKKSRMAALYDVTDIIDEISAIENLIVFHKNKGLNIFVRNQKKRIQQERFIPVDAHLNSMRDYLFEQSQNTAWQEYEAIYAKKHGENEIFSDTFFEYTLRGLSPIEVIRLLKEKRKRLKQLSIDTLKYVTIEQGVEFMLNDLTKVFSKLAEPSQA